MDTENSVGTLTTVAEKPSSPLAVALTTHQDYHGRVSELLTSLERRLSIVLRPEGPADAQNEGKEAPSQSDLVSAMQGSNSRLKSYERRIANLLDRLEI